jgi:DNA-binding NtrC family response regulator
MSAQARVLVVDDDEVVRRSYQRSLQTVRCDVEAVANGEDALKAVKQHPYDVLLLDLRMPSMDGLSVLKTVKAVSPESEVVIITGYPTIDSAKEAVQLGACDYLAKPVGPAEVISATNAAIAQKMWALRKDSSTKNVSHNA